MSRRPPSATAKPPPTATSPSPTVPSPRLSCKPPSPPSISFFRGSPPFAQSVSEVEFFTSADESALLVSLSTRLHKVPEQLPRSVADGLLPSLPALRGVCTFSLDPRGRPHSSASWGKPSLEYAVGPLRYQVSAGAFFQVNRYLDSQVARRGYRSAKRQRCLGPLCRRRSLRSGSRAAL